MTDVGYSPLSGMRVALDGSITYDFDGHVHAQGLDLDGSELLTGGPDDRKVRWLRPSDGQVVAELEGIAPANATQSAGLLASAEHPDTDLYARLRVLAGDAGGSAEVLASDGAGGEKIRALFNSDGDVSSFIQLGGAVAQFGRRVQFFYGGFIDFDVAPGGAWNGTFPTPFNDSDVGGWIAFGGLDQSGGGGFADYAQWAYDSPSASHIRVFITNRHPTDDAVGTLQLLYITLD